ncbi:hypothetical protein DFR30_1238 [Thiogranum longum]|uniref:Uncharacterized protein n=1 Tax=Thiogranum longum TaxID=1537524 RepID=A0A4R1HF43_9GAMM|nr:hypothetical protein [Thiogranum longum]TCK17979.1 hypothetical protein DFR30_1238 [Thiogranum longum]
MYMGANRYDATWVTERLAYLPYGAILILNTTTGAMKMRDYGNMPKIDWQDDKPTLVKVKAQLMREEPVILQLPDGFRLDFDAQACGCEGEPDLLLDCQPQGVFAALAENNNMPAMAEIGEQARETGQIVDVDIAGQRLILHD